MCVYIYIQILYCEFGTWSKHEWDYFTSSKSAEQLKNMVPITLLSVLFFAVSNKLGAKQKTKQRHKRASFKCEVGSICSVFLAGGGVKPPNEVPPLASILCRQTEQQRGRWRSTAWAGRQFWCYVVCCLWLPRPEKRCLSSLTRSCVLMMSAVVSILFSLGCCNEIR